MLQKQLDAALAWFLRKYEHADGEEILFEKRTKKQKPFGSLNFKYHYF